MDSRLRGNDGSIKACVPTFAGTTVIVIPADAGIQVVDMFQKNVESLGPGFRWDDRPGRQAGTT